MVFPFLRERGERGRAKTRLTPKGKEKMYVEVSGGIRWQGDGAFFGGNACDEWACRRAEGGKPGELCGEVKKWWLVNGSNVNRIQGGSRGTAKCDRYKRLELNRPDTQGGARRQRR